MSINSYSFPRRLTFRRLIWRYFSRLLTIIIPDFALRHVGGMPSFGVNNIASRTAWREKISLLILFLLSAGLFCFWLEFVSSLFCDPERIFSYDTIFSNDSNMAVINGKVVDWRQIPNSPIADFVNQYPHHDLSANFPKFMMLSRTSSNTLYADKMLNDCIFHQNRASSADAWLNHLLSVDSGYLYDKTNKVLLECPVPDHPNVTGAPCFYSSNYKSLFNDLPVKGDIQYEPDTIQTMYNTLPSALNYSQQAYVVLDGNVLDVTAYLKGATTIVPVSSTVSSRSLALDRMFLPLDLTILLYTNLGKDITKYFESNVTEDSAMYRQCLAYLFKKGIVPSHVSSGCARFNPALWATMGVGLIYFVFKASLTYLSRMPFVQRFLYSPTAETSSIMLCHQWPHTMLVVPCFAEPFETLKMTVDSLSRSTYEDNKKLLLFVCDGITMSSQSESYSHSLLLEYLGYSCKEDPLCYPYTSLGQNKKKINHARVYSGFYETGRNRVPYLVIVKIGQPQEETEYYQSHMSTAPPGNRGKRDSIVLILGFLERCMNLARNRMSPLEYEIFNQCYNVLGIDPRKLKYMMVADADVQVQSDTIQKLVLRLEEDRRLLAVSGHVRPANPEQNFITMLQIFPFYMTYYSRLAYEACMRSVMTLTGGLVMYKIWAEAPKQPIDYKFDKKQRLLPQHHNAPVGSQLSANQRLKLSDEIVVKNPFSDSDSRTSSMTNDTATTMTTVGTRTTTVHQQQLQQQKYRVHNRPSSNIYTPSQRVSARPDSRLLLTTQKDIELRCAHPTVLRGLATAQPNTMHMQNVLLLGEDRIASLVLLKSHPNYRLGFEPEAIGYTLLPTNFFSLQGQEIRRIRSAFHIQFEIQCIAWQLGFAFWLFSTIELIEAVFALPVTLYLYNIFGRSIEKLGLSYFVVACSFMGLAALHMVFFLLRRQFRYIFWFLLYCIVSMPLFVVYFPLMAAWQSNYSEYWYDVWPTSAGRSSRFHGLIDRNIAEKQSANRSMHEKLANDQPPKEKTNRQSAYTISDFHESDGKEAIPRMRMNDYEIFEANRLYQAAEAALDSSFAGFTDFAREGDSFSHGIVETAIVSPPSAQVRDGVHSTRTTANYRPSSTEIYHAKIKYPNIKFEDELYPPSSSTSPYTERSNPFDDVHSITRSRLDENYLADRFEYPNSSDTTNNIRKKHPYTRNTFRHHHSSALDNAIINSMTLNNSGFAETLKSEQFMAHDSLGPELVGCTDDALSENDRASTLSISSKTFSIHIAEGDIQSMSMPRHRIGNQYQHNTSLRNNYNEGRHRAVHNFTTTQP
ncbi:chitin synthase-domain-containing protein [Blakeslea trispora]|nr:chitin synthase-domain-containing protein [Blakeslea trispora]